ncbi:MAG: hypothetical protein WCD89_09425 [Anaerocolumna sp.]
MLNIGRRQLSTFLSHEGTKFTRKHNVPLWVGEFGSVYNGAREDFWIQTSGWVGCRKHQPKK